jgi:hypothetical protein
MFREVVRLRDAQDALVVPCSGLGQQMHQAARWTGTAAWDAIGRTRVPHAANTTQEQAGLIMRNPFWLTDDQMARPKPCRM